jgi:poly(3-hydroxybutyrate) depolymerase
MKPLVVEGIQSKVLTPSRVDKENSREVRMKLFSALAAIAFALTSFPAVAADYPAPKQGDRVARDFRFHTGDVMSELRIHYTTVGDPSGQPVLVLHGTGGSAATMLSPHSAANYLAPANRSMRPNITSSFRTR